MTETELKPVHEGCRSYWRKAKVVSFTDGTHALVSYGTTVAATDADGRLHKLWDGWTRTTGRHLVEFARQFAPSAAVPRKAVWDRMPWERLQDVTDASRRRLFTNDI